MQPITPQKQGTNRQVGRPGDPLKAVTDAVGTVVSTIDTIVDVEMDEAEGATTIWDMSDDWMAVLTMELRGYRLALTNLTDDIKKRNPITPDPTPGKPGVTRGFTPINIPARTLQPNPPVVLNPPRVWGKADGDDVGIQGEEADARRKVREMDNRTNIPPGARLSGLAPLSLLIVAAMRSPLALEAIRMLVSSPPPPPPPPSAEADARLAVVIRHCRDIERMEREDLSCQCRGRKGQLDLVKALERRRGPNRDRNTQEDINEVLRVSGWTRSRYNYEQGLGRTVQRATRSHRGLAVFIPLESRNRFDLAPRKVLHNLNADQAQRIGQMMTDTWARVMCRLGSDVMAYVAGEMGARSPMLDRLATSKLDFGQATLAELETLFAPWAGVGCNCP